MIETNNIIITNFHIPVKNILRECLVSNVTNGGINDITNPRSIIRTTIDDIVIHWLCRKYHIAIYRTMIGGELADICNYSNIKNVLTNTLETRVRILNNHAHTRHIWYSSYLVNTTLFVVVRSCKEFN